MSENSGLIAVNGRIEDAARSAIPALDRGVLFGDAVFEVLVAFQGKILHLSRHLDRLRASAEMVGMEVPWNDAVLEFELQAMVDQLALPKAYLRLVMSRGEGSGLRPAEGLKPNRMAYCLPAPSEPVDTYRDGVALRRVIRGGVDRGAHPKTPNYQPAVVALQRAAREGYHDILWTNADGEIAEASASNIFFMARDGDSYEFITPPAASGILLGITRQTILDLMRKAGLPVREALVFVDELPRFDEAFLCSSIKGLVPIDRIDQQRLYTTRKNAAFRHVERLFLTWVETQIGVRVDWRTGQPART